MMYYNVQKHQYVITGRSTVRLLLLLWYSGSATETYTISPHISTFNRSSQSESYGDFTYRNDTFAYIMQMSYMILQLNWLEIVGHRVCWRQQTAVTFGELHTDSGTLKHHSGAAAVTRIVDHRRHSAVRVNTVDVPLPLVIACQVRIVRHQLIIFLSTKLCRYTTLTAA